MKLSPVTLSDLQHISALQPEGWLPIIPYYEFYVNSNFCFPIKAVIADKIVGIGAANYHELSGWLGHIIVDKQFRNLGIGTAVTKALMDQLYQLQAKTISLVATPMGEPIYHKLGFQKESVYVFLHNGKTTAPSESIILPFESQFKEAILKMDKNISGENRSKLLDLHLTKAHVVVEHGSLTGFYIPTLGEGLILAETKQTGELLMRLKHSQIDYAAIPIENQAAITFLKDHGFTEFRRAVRMWLGEKLLWQPDKIFGRIGGHLG